MLAMCSMHLPLATRFARAMKFYPRKASTYIVSKWLDIYTVVQCRGGQCHLEANVFFLGEANVGEINVIAPFLPLIFWC